MTITHSEEGLMAPLRIKICGYSFVVSQKLLFYQYLTHHHLNNSNMPTKHSNGKRSTR